MKLPDGGSIYRVLLWNGVDVLCRCNERVEIGPRCYEQDVWLFDKKLHIAYEGGFNLLFDEYKYGMESYVFSVDAVTSGIRYQWGKLSVVRHGKINFNGEDISRTKIDRMWAKASVLCAS